MSATIVNISVLYTHGDLIETTEFLFPVDASDVRRRDVDQIDTRNFLRRD